MSRPKNEVPTDRFNVSLPRPVAERVRALAERQRRSGPAAIASLVTYAVLGDAGDETAEEERVQASPLYQRLTAERDELSAALMETRRQLAEQRRATPADLQQTPRWAWPLDCLLADDDWWGSWLPKLYELLGSEAPGRSAAHADHCYLDLMAYLFPPIGSVTWRSLKYRAAVQTDTSSSPVRLTAGPGRALAWEPVIRHVARALAALETTEAPDADPYHAMRVQAEISGPWVGVLRHLLGKSPAELHDLPLWATR
jgi:hypothetical protein